MAENIFILGAGASVEAGAPVMSNFLDRAEDMITTIRPDSVDKFKSIYDLRNTIQAIHAKSYLDLDNIETLFGLLEMAKIAGGLNTYNADTVNTLRDNLIFLIVNTLEQSIQYPIKNEGTTTPSPPKGYDKFCQLIDNYLTGDATIITFNYDVALDVSLHQHKFEVDYCLSDNPISHKGKYIRLLKLHGSTNWAKYTSDDGRINIVAYDMERFAKKYFRHTLYNDDKYRRVETSRSFSDLRQEYPGIDDLPIIVPPTWTKSEYQSQQLGNVWRVAAEELKTARNIYVFGFSLPESDVFFKYLFAVGTFSQTRLSRFFVFDPNQQVEENYKKFISKGIASRFRFYNKTFTEAVYTLSTELQMPLENQQMVHRL